MQKIGLRLQRIRKQNGVSQEELAKKLHVQRQTISSYERGVSTPDIYILIAMADYFEVSVDELVGRNRKKKSLWSWRKRLKKHRKRTYRQPRVKGRNSLSYRRSGNGRRS